jgi:hypothetical protein
MPPQQNQNTITPNSLELDPQISSSTGTYSAPVAAPDSNLAAYPNDAVVKAENPQTKSPRRVLRRTLMVLAALLILAAPFFIWSFYNSGRSNEANNLAELYPTTSIPLEEFVVSGSDFNNQNVTINGTLQANNSLILTPGEAPLNPTAGQMYYDQTSNVLAYYDGTGFVPVVGGDGQVTSLGGQSGAILLGNGLSFQDGTLNNSGVTSLQGVSGEVALSSGAGIAVDGLTVSNTGVIDLIAGNNVSVINHGDGTRTINVAATAGNVTTSGGTNGTIPLFTSGNNIQDSILTQSGAVVTVGGSLNLASALSVSNGGTGSTSLTTNGVLVGNGTNQVISVTTGIPNQCLRSTAGAPIWGSCGSGVTSLNGQSGGVSIANASGAGGVVTIDNASTATKGIARFNSTNFTAVGGDINTIQNINASATPTFAGINTSTITPSGTLNVAGDVLVQGDNVTIGTALLQGTLNLFDSSGNLATIQTAADLGNNIAYTLPTPSGAATSAEICLSTGNCAGAGSSITGGGTAGRLAMFDAAQNIVNSSILESAGSINILGAVSDFSIQGGGLAVGESGSNTAGAVAIYSDNGNSITLDVASGMSGNYTYSLPDVGQNAGICLTTGNCVGGGGGTAPSDAQYLTLATDPDLANERILAAGSNLTTTDGGAGGNFTIGTVQNPTFTTSVTTPLVQSSADLNINSTGAMTLNPGTGTTTVNGNIDLITGNQYQINGTQISSAALSNNNNLAKLSQSQTFTGNNNTFQNGADSTNAFAIQNALGTNIFNVDSTNGQIILGEDNVSTGQIAFNHQASSFTGTMLQGALTASRTYTLPDESGILCLQNSASCGFELAGNAFVQGGNAFGATGLLGTTDAQSLEVITNNTTRLTISASGAVENQGSLRNAGHVAIGANSSVSNNTLLSMDETFTSGTISGVDGIIRLNPGAADGNYHTGLKFQLQTDGGNAQNFTGGLRGATIFAQHNGTGTVNEIWGAELRVDNTNTGTVGSTVALRVESNNNSGGGTINDNYGLYINSQTAGTNDYAIYTNSGTVRFGDIVQTQTLGTADNNTQLCRNSQNQIATCSSSGSGASFVQGGNSFGATATIGTNDSNSLEVETNGTTQLTIAVGGATTFQNSVDSVAAFRVMNASTVPLFQIDTTNSRAYIGNPTADATGALLVLDTKNTAGDPTGANGGMYYNSNDDKFRCYEGGVWLNCIDSQVGVQSVRYTSSGTFDKADYPGMKAIIMEAVGAGGGGGGAASTGANQAAVGGGGGGGNYMRAYIPVNSLAPSETVTVGTGGAGGTAGANNGSAGGSTSFGSFCSTDGAGGGSGATATSSSSGAGTIYFGASSGGFSSGSFCDITSGSYGDNGTRVGDGGIGQMGNGGGSFFAGKLRAQTSSTGANGLIAGSTRPGAGGSGGFNFPNQATARTGGAGANGLVIITIIY